MHIHRFEQLTSHDKFSFGSSRTGYTVFNLLQASVITFTTRQLYYEHS